MTKYRQDTVYYGGKNKSCTLYKTLWTLKMGNTVKSSFDFMQCIQLSVFCGCWDAAYQTRWHTCAQEWCLFSFRCHMEGRWESNLWMKTHTQKTKKQLDKKSVQIEDKMSNGIYVARLVTRSGVLIFNFSQLSCRLLRILTSLRMHRSCLLSVVSHLLPWVSYTLMTWCQWGMP